MARSRIRRPIALVTGVAVLATISAATVAAPAAAAKPKCGGKVATIVGTAKADVIRGTSRRDVIVARGGRDKILGRGGRDIICGGGGNDVLKGGPGWDQLDGGAGIDACYTEGGGGKTIRCEFPAKTLAIAYSDLDGSHTFNAGDVLIAKLVDSNGDKIPSAGDTIKMGRYPRDFTASAFGTWNIKTHTVTTVTLLEPFAVKVDSSAGSHQWTDSLPTAESRAERYREEFPGADIQDGRAGGAIEILDVSSGSPSSPSVVVSRITDSNETNDVFIDVDLDYVVP